MAGWRQGGLQPRALIIAAVLLLLIIAPKTSAFGLALNSLKKLNLPAQAAQTSLNLRDFGAVSDGVTDTGPALQSALNALATAGGGTLIVPSGQYALLTPVAKDFSSASYSIILQG